MARTAWRLCSFSSRLVVVEGAVLPTPKVAGCLGFHFGLHTNIEVLNLCTSSRSYESGIQLIDLSLFPVSGSVF